MQSLTWGSDEGMQALYQKQAGVYINLADFKTLVDSLRFVAANPDPANPDLGEAASDLLCSIAESLGIEFI